MTAVIDTCVILDFLQNREPFSPDALKLFRSAASGLFSAAITASSVTDIYYIIRRANVSDEKARALLSSLLSLVTAVSTDPCDIFRALSSSVKDFEDAVMIETAVRIGADCIITRNGRDYSPSPVKALPPADFLAKLNAE